MTRRERERLWRTAVHEAGHAVAAFKLDLPFRWVSVKPNPERGRSGHVVGLQGSGAAIYAADVGRTLTARQRVRLENDCVVLLAGA